MNINAIQKHYGKLSTVERFGLMNAAARRGDNNELITLRDSAPRRSWSIPITRGLFEAFEFLAMWHVMTMLEAYGLYWALIAIGDDTTPGGDDNTWGELLRGVMGRALSRQAAWVEVCAEYGVDPWQWLNGLPGVDTVKLFLHTLNGDHARRGLLDAAAVEVEPKPYVDDYRAVIAEHRRQWE